MQPEQRYHTLKAIEQRMRQSKDSPFLWSIIQGIHAAPVLRDWVSLESRPLQPYVTEHEQGHIIHLLLAIPSATDESMRSPWGYIAWSWPDRKIVAMLNVENALKNEPSEISVASICTAAFAEKIEQAIQNNAVKPGLYPALQSIYDLLRQKGLLVTTEKQGALLTKSAVPTGNITNPVALVSKDVLLGLLEQVEDLIDQTGHKDLQPELLRIRKMMSTDYFTVGVVGEFSRGKSTLVNHLMDEDILPVGALATTKHFTRIRYGTARHIYWRDDNGSRVIETISEFEASNTTESGFFLLELPDDRLQKSGLQLIDTPGAGDLDQKWFNQTVDLISSCDATLMVISANMPLSLTEQQFIEQHLLAKKIPRLGVVITWLDQIGSRDRSKVVQHIQQRIQQIAPQAVVCTSQSFDEVTEISGIVSGIEAIYQLLEQWAQDPSHIAIKQGQIKLQAQDVVFLIKQGLHQQLSLLKLEQDERETALKSALDILENSRIDWEELSLEMLKKSRLGQAWVEQNMDIFKEQISEKLQFELKQTPNPKGWIEESFPFRMKQELSLVGQQFNNRLESRLVADFRWAEAELQRRWSWLYKHDTLQNNNKLEFKINGLPNQGLQDLNKFRTFARIGVSGISILGFMLYGPLGMAISLGGGILGEHFLNKNIKRQKEDLANHLKTSIDYNLLKITTEITRRLDQSYLQVVQDLRSQESLWFATQKHALEKANIYISPVTLEKQLQQASALEVKLAS